jgi:alpha-N-arabinofuranosidase
MHTQRVFILLFLLFTTICLTGQINPCGFRNPILPGFAPDPSICRVGDDYFLVTSSFTWFPGLPIYHSKDLVNWKLIGHGITRSEQLSFNGLEDKYGIWAPTIRFHNGLFYISSTNRNGGGNFYITSADPSGEWSNPVWLKEAEGIDPSLFWDDDGTCYYTGNCWNFDDLMPGKVVIWGQKLDLENQKLIGDIKYLTYGHANNASYTEAPHIYKINKKYLLITAEGGTNENHAVTAHHSSKILDTYSSNIVNPVLTHRHLGKDHPVQAVGHADLVQTQKGDWWAVVLGKRQIDGEFPLSRETFLCKVKMENDTPIFNPGEGKVLMQQERPDLPWTPVKVTPSRDEFDTEKLGLKWHTVRVPTDDFFTIRDGKLNVKLRPQMVDSLVNSSILIQPTKHFNYSVTTQLFFDPKNNSEQAGLIIYRTYMSYYMLLKEKSRLVLIKKDKGVKETIAEVDYSKKNVYLSLKADGLNLQFSFGESAENLTNIGGMQSMVVIAESEMNKFNGTGVGVYATSNGQDSRNTATYDWFEYKGSSEMN